MKKIISYVVFYALAGCSSAPKTSVDVPVTKPDQPDYVVRERNPNPAPDWSRDFSKFKRENDGKGATYFLGESGDTSDRIAGCDMSTLDSKKHIAEQIATLISSKIAATKSGQLLIDKDNPNDPGLRKAFESDIAGKSMAFLSGVKQFGQYWEERDYSVSGGKKRVYLCSTVAMISDDDLKWALRKAANKTADVQEDPEAKQIVKESLKDIDTQFKNYSGSKEN